MITDDLEIDRGRFGKLDRQPDDGKTFTSRAIEARVSYDGKRFDVADMRVNF